MCETLKLIVGANRISGPHRGGTSAERTMPISYGSTPSCSREPTSQAMWRTHSERPRCSKGEHLSQLREGELTLRPRAPPEPATCSSSASPYRPSSTLPTSQTCSKLSSSSWMTGRRGQRAVAAKAWCVADGQPPPGTAEPFTWSRRVSFGSRKGRGGPPMWESFRADTRWTGRAH